MLAPPLPCPSRSYTLPVSPLPYSSSNTVLPSTLIARTTLVKHKQGKSPRLVIFQQLPRAHESRESRPALSAYSAFVHSLSLGPLTTRTLSLMLPQFFSKVTRCCARSPFKLEPPNKKKHKSLNSSLLQTDTFLTYYLRDPI